METNGTCQVSVRPSFNQFTVVTIDTLLTSDALLIHTQVRVAGAENEDEAAKVARTFSCIFFTYQGISATHKLMQFYNQF
nr:hypothetical protein Iba_chr04aCG21720 [Ipomoea batatas]